MAIKLTDAKLLGLKSPTKGQAEYSDSQVPGLRVRIGTSGTKTFILRKRVGGRIRNITVGRYSARFGLADARKKARGLITDIEAGKPVPAVINKSAANVGTFNDLIPLYLASKAHLRSIGEIERILSKILPDFGDRLADCITRIELTELIEHVAIISPSSARALLAQLSAFYTWALPRFPAHYTNPCRDAWRPAKSAARERVLTFSETAALWHVAANESLPWGPALHLLLLTGARRSEVLNADRSEFDLAAGEWIIPAQRAKNGRPHLIPLVDRVVEIVSSIPVVSGSDKLFPARGNLESGPTGFSKAQARFRASVNTRLGRELGENWTLHDIRRTVATGLQRLGVRFEVTEAILNHVGGSKSGIAGVYQRHDWKDEKRAALELWSADLMKTVTHYQ